MTDAATMIRAKRDGHRLADDDIRWLFEAYARHEVAGRPGAGRPAAARAPRRRTERFGPALAAVQGAIAIGQDGPPPRVSPVIEYITAQ